MHLKKAENDVLLEVETQIGATPGGRVAGGRREIGD